MDIISKPAIVEILRLFDEECWVTPRIRYASVRSKPELIADILKFFSTRREGSTIVLCPRLELQRCLDRVPPIHYCTKKRTWRVRHQPLLPARERRISHQFRVTHCPVRLQFP